MSPRRKWGRFLMRRKLAWLREHRSYHSDHRDAHLSWYGNNLRRELTILGVPRPTLEDYIRAYEPDRPDDPAMTQPRVHTEPSQEPQGRPGPKERTVRPLRMADRWSDELWS